MKSIRVTALLGVLALLVMACGGPAASVRTSASPAASQPPATPTAAATTPQRTATAPAATPTTAATDRPSEAPSAAPSEAPSEAPSAAPSGSAGTALQCEGESVTFMLSFLANIQHAGFLIAEEQGYYDELGMTVEIVPAGPGTDVAAAVADGTADLGQVDYVPLVAARNRGVPIKAVAQIYKDPFFFWYSAAEGGPATVVEWEGMRVGSIQRGQYPERDAMMLAAGADPESITEVEQAFDGVLNPEQMDIAEGVVFFHPALINAGVIPGLLPFPDNYNVFRPAELGADFASQTVAGNETFVAENPNAIACFLAGSIRGWQAAFDDENQAVESTMTFVPEDSPITAEHQLAALPDVLAITGTGSDDATLLQPDEASYQSTLDQLVEVGYLDEGEVPDVTETYDGSFWDMATGAQ